MTSLSEALSSGRSYAQAGDLLGISRDAARMRAVRAGLRSSLRQRPRNPETARRVRVARQMLAQGCETGDVAQRLAMSKAAVRMMLRRARDV